MFFVSRTCYYITDKRIVSIKTDKDHENILLADISITDFPEQLKKILNDPEQRKKYDYHIKTFKNVMDRCDYAHKHIEIDKKFGFRFVADDCIETKLSLYDLSSGEKHMLIQIFSLLFVAQEGTLVLIDEPELSLHMIWQMNYLKNLEEILHLRRFQCIVATHSPQVFNSLWTKSVDLYELSKIQ